LPSPNSVALAAALLNIQTRTHARNYRISTVHTNVENTLQRYASVRRLGFCFAVGYENQQNVLSTEETHERCEIKQKSME